MNHRGNTVYDWFASEVSRFIQDLQARLFIENVRLQPMDSLDESDFAELMSGSREKTLVAALGGEMGNSAFLFLEAPTARMREQTLAKELLPSLGFALRNEPNRLYVLDALCLGS